MPKHKDLVKRVLLYILIIYLTLISLYGVAKGFYFIGLISLILLIFLFPIVNKFLKKRFSAAIPGALRYFIVIAIITASKLTIKDYWSFFFTPIIGILFYLVYRSSKRDVLLKQKEQKIIARNKELLQRKNLYSYVENFVSKYARLESISNTEVALDYISPSQMNKLKTLLEEKGLSFSDDEIKNLIKDNLYEKDYLRLKNRILRKKPNTVEDYAKSFGEIYGYDFENKEYYIDFLLNLIIEKELEIRRNDLIELLEKFNKEIELKRFEKNISTKPEHDYSIKQIDYMNGYQFQSFLARLFEKMGFKIERTNLSWDQGADLLITKFSERYIIQAKRYREKVNNHAIQEVSAAIKHYKADKGIVITTNYFTKSAIELARSHQIRLIDRKELRLLIQNYL